MQSCKVENNKCKVENNKRFERAISVLAVLAVLAVDHGDSDSESDSESDSDLQLCNNNTNNNRTEEDGMNRAYAVFACVPVHKCRGTRAGPARGAPIDDGWRASR